MGKQIYLIKPGEGIAKTNDERYAKALEQVGLVRCTKDEYLKAQQELNRADDDSARADAYEQGPSGYDDMGFPQYEVRGSRAEAEGYTEDDD